MFKKGPALDVNALRQSYLSKKSSWSNLYGIYGRRRNWHKKSENAQMLKVRHYTSKFLIIASHVNSFGKSLPLVLLHLAKKTVLNFH